MAEPTYNFEGLKPKTPTAMPPSLLPTEEPKSRYNFSGLKRKPEKFGPATPEGFVSPKPPSAFEKFVSGAKEAVSGAEKYIGEQVLAPPVLKTKRAISSVLPESVRKLTGFEMTPEQLKKAEEPGAPAVPLSKLAPSMEAIEKLPTPYKRLASIGKGALEVAEGLTTAENVALISALGGAPKAVQSAISAGFAYMMGKELPTQWKEFKEAKTEAEKIRLATHAVATLGFTAAAATHAVTGVKGAVEEREIGKGRAKALPELERAGMEAGAVTRIAEREKAARTEQQKYEPVTAEGIRKRAVMDVTDLNAKLAKGEKLHPNDQKALDFLKTNLENPDALARAYKRRVESPEVVEQFATERANKLKEQTEAEVKKQQEKLAKERQKTENLETPQLRIQAVAEQLARDEFKKPFEKLAVTEKNAIRERAASEYVRRLRSISKELEATDEKLRGARNRTEREHQAQEILRQRLVEEKAAKAPPVEEVPTAGAPPVERGLVEVPRELGPEEVEVIPPRELPAPPVIERRQLAPPVEELLPEEILPTEPVAPKALPVELTPAERKEKFAAERQALAERKLKFARQQQAERERVAAERFAAQEEKRIEVLKKKLGEKYRVRPLKEKPKEALKPKVEKKAPVTAEIEPITGKEPIKGQPPTGKLAVMEKGREPVAARPTVPKVEVPEPAEKVPIVSPKVERPISPRLAKFRPSEQFEKAKTAIASIKRTEGWQDRARRVLEKEGYPSRIVDELTAPTRFARPSEPFSPEFATTREGRVERAIEPPKELKSRVDKIADAGRRNQIAQARYDKAKEELLAEIKKEGKEGIVAEIDTKGNFKITVKDPNALTESTKAAIKKIEQAEIDKGSFKPKMVSTELQIAVAPGAEALKGLELKGSLAAKVAETVLRKEQAKKTEIVFDKLKDAYKNDLFDYYLTHEPGALLGRTKEGLPTEILIRRVPSVKGAGEISELAGRQIAALKTIDRTHTETGTALLESAKNRANWEDKMVAQFGKAIKPKLSDIWDTVQYVKDNKHLDIRSIGEKLARETDRTRFKFIRKTLSEADQAKFDAVLDKIKTTDTEILGRANDFGAVLAGTAKQYANYAEFGYWTLKSLGKAGLNKAAWAAKMVEGMGEKIKPFLDDLWDKINRRNYEAGMEFTEADLPKVFRDAEIKQPKVKSAESSLPDDPPEIKPPKAADKALEPEKKVSRPVPGIGFYVESIIKTVERAAPKIAQGFRQAIDYWENNEGKGNAMILPLARKLRFRPTALGRLDDISRTDGNSMWDNWHEWTTKPQVRPRDLSGNESQALNIYKKLLDRRIQILKEAGREKVEIVDFKRVPSFDLLDAIRSEGSSVWNTLVSELARLNDLPIGKVQSYLKRYRLEKFEQFPTHIKVGQGTFADIVPVLATQGISALRALNRDTARLAGITKVFGDGYNKNLSELRKDISTQAQSDFDLMRDSYFGVRRLENARNLGKRILINLAQPIIRTALLARSFVQQPTQIASAIRLTTGKTFLQGLTDLAKNGTKAELEAIGVYAPGILDLAWQKGQRIEDFGRIASEIGSNLSLLKPAIELTDLGIVAAMRRFALDIKERGGKLLPREKNTLEVLNFTPEQINLINKKGLEGYENADVLYSSIISRGRKAVTFTGLKGPEKTKFQLSPLLSQLVQFQSFNIGQMQQAAGVARNLRIRWNALDKAQTAEEKNTAQAQLGSAVKQAAILFGATLGAAEANIFMKSLINGADIDRPEDAKRLFEDLVETGWVPFLREISYGFATDPTRLTLPGSIASEFSDALVGRGQYRDREGYERAAMFADRYATKPYTQGYTIARNVMIAAGLTEGNPTLKTATRNYWDFLRKNDAFKASEREGYNEVQAAMREVLNAVKESEPGQFGEATRRKINENIAKAIKAKTVEITERKPELDVIEATIEAQKRIRQGLLARRTLTELYKKESGYFEIGDKKFTREQLDDALRGGKYTDAMLQYDRLLTELADNL